MTALLVLPEGSASLAGGDEAQMCVAVAKMQFLWPCLQRQCAAGTAAAVNHDLSTA